MGSLPTTLPAGWENRTLSASPAIQQRVAEIIGSIPGDKNVAVVATATLYGAKLALFLRGPEGLTFRTYVGREWGGKVDFGAELRYVR